MLPSQLMMRSSSALLAVLLLAACRGPSTPEGQLTRPTSSVTASALPSVAATAVPATATPAPAEPSPRCHTANLSLKFAGAQGAAGTMFLTFRLANVGPAACQLRGFVGMQMLDAASAPMQTRVIRNGGFFANQPPPSAFLVRPAGSGSPAATAATFQVAYSNVPRAGEASCPEAYQLLVTPPDEFDHLSIPVQGWTLAPCNHGELDVTPVRPPGVASQ